MRSKIAKRILDSTPDSVRDEVRERARLQTNFSKMTNEEYQKIEDVLRRFADYEGMVKKYRESTSFHKCVMMLARGVSHEEVLLRMIEVVEDTQKAFEYQLLNSPPRLRFLKDDPLKPINE